MSWHASDFRGNTPAHYDHDLVPVLFADYAADIAARAAVDPAPAHVLETAAGSGVVTQALRHALPPGTHIVATDLNPAMLELAQTKIADGEAVEFRQADALDLPFPDGSFDAVVCQFGIMFFPDKDKGYREAFRVLAPGGRYLFNVWDSLHHNSIAQAMDEALEKFFDERPNFFDTVFGYYRVDDIRDALHAAGFGRVVIAVEPRRGELPDIPAIARGTVFGTPLHEQIKQRGGDPAAVQEEMTAALRRRATGPGAFARQAIVFEARKP
jgi:SAM-dependent methyltransferase